MKTKFKKTLACLVLVSTIFISTNANIPFSSISYAVGNAEATKSIEATGTSNSEPTTKTETPPSNVQEEKKSKWIPFYPTLTFENVVGRKEIKDNLLMFTESDPTMDELNAEPNLCILYGAKGNGKSMLVKALANKINAAMYIFESPNAVQNAENSGSTGVSSTEIDAFFDEIIENQTIENTKDKKAVVLIENIEQYALDNATLKELGNNLNKIKESGLPIYVIATYVSNSICNDNFCCEPLSELGFKSTKFGINLNIIKVLSLNLEEFEQLINKNFWDNLSVQSMVEMQIGCNWNYKRIINKIVYKHCQEHNFSVSEMLKLIKEWKLSIFKFWRTDKVHKITIKKISQLLDDILFEEVDKDVQKDMEADKEENKLCIAYHEIGHSITLMACKNWNLYKVSILPRKNLYLGVNIFDTKNYTDQTTASEICKFIIACLGGRAAEEVVYGEFGAGACSDLVTANTIARNQMYVLGMSPTVGQFTPIKIDNKFEDSLKSYVNNCYHSACETLKACRPLLDELAQKLVQEGELMGCEVKEAYDKFIEKHPDVEKVIAENSKLKWSSKRLFG